MNSKKTDSQLKKGKKKKYLSLTLEQGSIISSLAAIRATQPSAMLFRYTNGVLPISCSLQNKGKYNHLSKRKHESHKNI